MKFAVFTTAAVLAGAAYAQNISSSCQAGLIGLATSDAGKCLQVSNLVGVLAGTGSIVTPVNTYLASLCNSTTPKCNQTTLQTAQSTITTACANDLSSLGGLLGFVDAVVGHYNETYAAACSKNSTTGDFCVVDALKTVESTTNTTVTAAIFTNLLAGDNATTASLQPALASGQLCTSCVGGIFFEIKQINPNITTQPLGQGLTGACGADFGASAPSASGSNATGTESAGASATSGATPAESSKKSASERLGVPAAVALVGAAVACLL